MQISKKMARKIQAKLQSMLPYEVNILNLSGQQLLSDSEKGELSIQESTSIENWGSKAGHSRELFAYGEKVGYLIIYSDASSNEFSLLLDLAKDLTESIVEAELKREEINAQENYQLALRNLLNYHDGIDVEAVRVILQKNSFECTVPRTMIYFDLFTKEQDQRIIALRDDTGNITAAGLVYDNFVEYCDFPSEDWTRIRTNNVIERLNREIRRRTRVVGTFPDGNSALMLVCARLRHVAGTQWGNKKYMNMKHLEVTIDDASIAG